MRTCTSVAPASLNMRTIRSDVVPLTIESSIIMTRFPSTALSRSTFSFTCTLDSLLLCFWLDKRTSHIAVLDKGCTIRNPGCQRIAKCCSISGLRHTCHQICLYRRILCQKLSGLDPACIYAHAVDMTVRSRKIYVLENTACAVFLSEVPWSYRTQYLFRRNGHNFSRQHITHKCCTNGVKCTGFRCDNIRIVTLSDTKRLKAVWVTRPDQFTRTCHNQCVSSP